MKTDTATRRARSAPLTARSGRHYRHTLVAAVAAMTLSAAAFAATPEAWWIDVANDREAEVMRELARGMDPNEVDAEGLPALMLAIRSGSWKVYDALLAHRKTIVEAENKHGETPLMYLALLGETERARALIERGAKVNRLGWTPLHYAASKGQVKTARMLLEKGAIVNAPAPDGTTALMMAAFSGQRDMVQLLLDRGADPTAVNLQKLTAADWARERGHGPLADDLTELAKRTQARREGREVAPPPAPRTQPAPASSGGSRYFDLDRFERDDD